MANSRVAGSSRSRQPGPSGRSGNVAADVWSLLLANIAGLTDLLASVEPELRRLSLDHKTLFLLSLLETYDQPSALSHALATPKPTITALVKRAESNGLLQREAVRGDLRRFRLMITPRGREVVGSGRQIIERAMQARLDRVSPSDLKAFARVVGVIATRAEAAPRSGTVDATPHRTS